MEGNYLTSGDLALFSEAKYGRMVGYEGCGYGYHVATVWPQQE